MEIGQLRYFVAVADAGSFSRAARELEVAQPSLSQQLKKLEDELGLRLLDRLPKGVVPTEAGRQLLEHARRVLAEIADARRRIGDTTPGHVTGALAVGAIPTVAPFVLPGVLRRFSARFPDVRLTVVEDVTDRLVQAVERGGLDVAVMSSAAVPTTVHCETVATEPLRLLLPVGHRLASAPAAGMGADVEPAGNAAASPGGGTSRGSAPSARGRPGPRSSNGRGVGARGRAARAPQPASARAAAGDGPRAPADATAGDVGAAARPIAWREVAGERLLVLQEMHCLAGQVSQFCDRAGGLAPAVFLRGAQLSTIAAMVAAGLGVSVVPEMMARAGPWPGCALRPLAPAARGEPAPARDLCVAWSLLRYRTNAARAFVELLHERVTGPHPT